MIADAQNFHGARFLERTVALAIENVRAGGRPFAALLVKDGEEVAASVNTMHLDGDPTAHAELLVVRAAGKKIGSLAGTTVYASGEPCPMCLAAMRLAGVAQVFHAYSNADGAPFGLSTAALRAELAGSQAGWAIKVAHIPASGPSLYALWQERNKAGSGA